MNQPWKCIFASLFRSLVYTRLMKQNKHQLDRNGKKERCTFKNLAINFPNS